MLHSRPLLKNGKQDPYWNTQPPLTPGTRDEHQLNTSLPAHFQTPKYTPFVRWPIGSWRNNATEGTATTTSAVKFSQRMQRHRESFFEWAFTNQPSRVLALGTTRAHRHQALEAYRHSHHYGKLPNITPSDKHTIQLLAHKRKRLRHKLKQRMRKNTEAATPPLGELALHQYNPTESVAVHQPATLATTGQQALPAQRTILQYFQRITPTKGPPKHNSMQKQIKTQIRTQAARTTQAVLETIPPPHSTDPEQSVDKYEYSKRFLLEARSSMIKMAPPRPSGLRTREPGFAASNDTDFVNLMILIS